MSWSHGYYAQGRYTSGFYRELLPSWLDFAAIICGNRPPRAEEGAHFRYLELGSGMGTHLCLMGLTHPEGDFTGVDFHPDHILHAQSLAKRLGLKNVHFIEADFVELASDPKELGESFEYVIAHGIISWVRDEIRESLISLASRMLSLGGLCYVSYNALPGKLFLSPLQELSLIESKRVPIESGQAEHPVLRAAKILDLAQGTENKPSPIATALPQLRHFIKSEVAKASSAYLSGEFLNEGWKPLSVTEMHRLATAKKMTYLGSATLPENFSHLLPDNIRSVVLGEPDYLVRELIKDIAINQGFRRDIFSKGTAALSSTDQFRLISNVKFCLQEDPEVDLYRFTTSFGDVTGDYNVYSRIERSLANESLSFSQLQKKHKRDFADLAQVVSFLCHSGRVGFYRYAGIHSYSKQFEFASEELMKMQLDGYEYNMRPALFTGSAVPFSLSESILEKCIRNGKTSDLNSELAYELEARGYSLSGEQSDIVEKYMTRRTSLLRQGVIIESKDR